MKLAVLEHLTKKDIELFRKVKLIVSALADEPLGGIELSCHHLSHAVGEYLGLTVQDGFFTPGFKHSWLVTGRGVIIDPYPPLCAGGPIMVIKLTDGSFLSPWSNLYLPSAAQDYTELQEETFRTQIQNLIAIICELFPEPSSR